jgi:hypothetical protein
MVASWTETKAACADGWNDGCDLGNPDGCALRMPLGMLALWKAVCWAVRTEQYWADSMAAATAAQKGT